VLKNKVKEWEQKWEIERERNLQLRMKQGQAFMKALEDPSLYSGSGKRKDALYNPDDDKALIRLMQTIDRAGPPGLETRLINAGDPKSKFISLDQFQRFLTLMETPALDFTPMERLVGFSALQGTFKKMKVAVIMENVHARAAMRKRVEEQTLEHIATYIKKRENMTI